MHLLLFWARDWADLIFEATKNGRELGSEGAKMSSYELFCLFCKHELGKALAVLLAEVREKIWLATGTKSSSHGLFVSKGDYKSAAEFQMIYITYKFYFSELKL